MSSAKTGSLMRGWSWCNRLSIDAVLVALAWQFVMTFGYLDRRPSWPEAFTLAGTVWLIYVADRLLDARRLDVTKPHSLRHRFHRDRARAMTVAWLVGLTAVAAVVVTHLPMELIRSGLIVAVGVLIYGASVHFTDASILPKEGMVGTLFAVGVSLLVWTNQPSVSLAVSTASAALLFSLNCRIVADAERDLDQQQSYPSAATRRPMSDATCWWWAPLVVVMQFTVDGPAVVRVSLLLAAMLLPVSRWFRQPSIPQIQPHCHAPTAPGTWADGLLLATPLLVSPMFWS